MMSMILIAAICVGCSVKEERSGCPCVLILDLSGVDPDKSDSLSLSVLSAGGYLYQDLVQSSAYKDLYTVDVMKGEYWLNIYSVEPGGEDLGGMLSSDGSTLTIPPGQDSPMVNMFSLSLSLLDETVEVPVALHKNYCTITISMVAEGESPFELAMIGEVCGYGKDGLPVRGDFYYEIPQSPEGTFQLRVPRQLDSSLRLSISDEEEVLREFAVGEYILESGYDWDAEDLEDVEMEIDYAKTNVLFEINGWVKTVEMEVVI